MATYIGNRPLTEINYAGLNTETIDLVIEQPFSSNYLWTDYISPNIVRWNFDNDLTASEQSQLDVLLTNHDRSVWDNVQDVQEEFPEGSSDEMYYNPSTSGLASNTVQGAIDELSSEIDDLSTNFPSDTDDLTEGSNNLYYTEDRVSANTDVAANTSARHTHSNKTELDLITDAGSGIIISDVERTKLTGIEEGAEVNQTDAEIKTQYENNADTNAYTDSEKTKLSTLESSKFLGTYISLTALETAHPSPVEGSYAYVDSGSGEDTQVYIWDNNDSKYVLQLGESTAETPASIKSKYESNADTNAFTDTEKTKLSGIEDGAEVNQTDAEIKTQYENNTDTNAFTDAEQTKLAGIDTGAQVNLVDSVNTQIGDVVLNTDDIPEGGTNGYYTETRFDASLATKTTADLTEGSNLYYTDLRVSANTDVAANTLKISADGSIDTHSDVDVSTLAPSNGQFLQWNGTNWVAGSGSAAPVDSVFGRVGIITAEANDYDSEQIFYDNSTSGLASNNVKTAIDEVNSLRYVPENEIIFNLGQNTSAGIKSIVVDDIEGAGFSITKDTTGPLNPVYFENYGFGSIILKGNGSENSVHFENGSQYFSTDGTVTTIKGVSVSAFRDTIYGFESDSNSVATTKAVYDFLDAENIRYDAGTNGLSSDNVQNAIDEHITNFTNPHNTTADLVPFDNTDSRYVSDNVDGVLNEIDDTLIAQVAQEFDAILYDQIRADRGDLALTDKICPAGTNVSTNIVSLETGNIIFLNGDLFNPIARLNQGEVFNFNANQNDKISSIKGCYVVTESFGSMVWNSLAFAGRFFFTEVVRNSSPFRMFISNFGAFATVNVTRNGTLDSTTVIEPNTTVEIDATGTGEYLIQSNELIDIFAIGDNNTTDSRPLPPASSELLWFNSSTAVNPNTAKVAVQYPDTEIEYFFQNGVTGTAIVQPGTSFALPNSVAQYGAEGACYIRSNGIIGATNAADQDGNNGTAWMPPNLATYRFGLPESSQHATFVSRFKGVVNVFLPGNASDIPDEILPLVQSGTAVEDGLFPYAVKDLVSRAAGTIYESDVPCNALFDESSGDETLLVGGLPIRETILSVNDKVGNIELTTDDIDEGINNLYYTEERVSANPDVVANTAKVGLEYKAVTDTWTAPATLDGQVQDLGQEAFVNGRNISTMAATALDPHVFLATSVVAGNEDFIEFIQPTSSDVRDGVPFGLNTTNADVDGYFKLATYGTINDVNTSAWTANTVLYVDDTTAGALTDIAPLTNRYLVGFVTKQHATEGKIFVNTLNSVNDSSSYIPSTFEQIWFTGQEETTAAGTFYQALREDRGTVASVEETVDLGDNEIDAFAQDVLGVSVPIKTGVNKGVYEAQLEVEVDISSANEKFYMEIYLADADGNVIDSGLDSEVIGDLGVKPLVVLESSLLNIDDDYTFYVPLTGLLSESIILDIGQRVRYHILAEKVGTAGATKAYSLFLGSDHRSFTKAPIAVKLDDLSDVDVEGAIAGNVLKKNASGLWVGGSLTQSEINGSTDDITEGANNLYYTEDRVSNNTDVLANTDKISADGSISTHSDVDITGVTDGDTLVWRTDKFEVEEPSTSIESFVDLTDTPASYTNQANKVVTVKDDESGLEFTDSGAGGDNFIREIDPAVENNLVIQTLDGQLVDAGMSITNNSLDSNKFHASKSSNQDLVVTPLDATVVDWDVPTVVNDAYQFDSTTGILTIIKTGWYNININSSHQAMSNARQVSYMWLEYDFGGGYVVVPGTRVIFYNRQDFHGSAGSINTLLYCGAGTDIVLKANIDPGASVEILANSTTFTVIKSEIGISVGPGGEPNVGSVFGRNGDVTAFAGDYNATQIDYDNTTSNLTAIDVQGAVDELRTKLANKPINETTNGFEQNTIPVFNVSADEWILQKSGIAKNITVSVDGINADFTSIKDAIDSILDASDINPYVIDVSPGLYTEQPMIISDYVLLNGCNGSVIMSADNDNPLITIGNHTSIFDFIFIGPTNAPTIYCNGGSTHSYIDRCFFRSGYLAIRTTNPSAELQTVVQLRNSYIEEGVSNAVEVLNGSNFSVYYSFIASTNGCYVDAAIFEIFNTSISGMTDYALKCRNAGLIKFSSIEISNSTTAIDIDTNASIIGSTIFSNVVDTVVYTGPDAITSRLEFNNYISIDVNVSEIIQTNLNTKIVISNGTLTASSVKNEDIANWSNIIIQILDIDFGQYFSKNVSIGSHINGNETYIGKGSPQYGDTYVYVQDELGVYTEIDMFSDEIASFPNTTLNNAIYITKSLIVNNESQTWQGFETHLQTLGLIDNGDIVIEKWDGENWITFPYMITYNISPNISTGKDELFEHFQQDIRFQPGIASDWVKNDPMSIGTEFYWIRCRITSDIDVSPNINKMYIHRDSARVDYNGRVEYYGRSRPYMLIPFDIDDIKLEPTSPITQSVNFYKTQSLFIPGTTSNNELRNATDTTYGYTINLPSNIDTSMLMLINLKYISDTTGGTINWAIRYSHIKTGDEIYKDHWAAPTSSLEVYEKTVSTVGPEQTNVLTEAGINIDISNIREVLLNDENKLDNISGSLAINIERLGSQDLHAGNLFLCDIEHICLTYNTGGNPEPGLDTDDIGGGDSKSVLFVATNLTTLQQIELNISNIFTSKNIFPVYVLDWQLSTDSWRGFDLVYVAPGINGDTVGNNFQAAEIPIIYSNNKPLPPSNLCNWGENGDSNTSNQMKILNTTHPITSGLTLGDTVVQSATLTITRFQISGTNEATGLVSGTNNTSNITLGVWDKGEAGINGHTVPERTVFYGISAGDNSLQGNGGTMFTNVIDWCLYTI